MGEGYAGLALQGPSRSWKGVIHPLQATSVKKHPPSISIARARALRSNPTDAERRMWRLLGEAFPQARFRRQVPIRHYIVDFASHALKLVVEIDGGQHSPEADAERTRVIAAEGYRIVRFWNHEVMENGEGCLVGLKELVQLAHRHPSPNEGRGRQ